MCDKIVSCRDCKSSLAAFASESSFRKHRRNKHKEANLALKIECPLDECSTRFSFYEQLDKHLEITHNIQIEREVIQFASKDEFDYWKTKRTTHYYEQFNSQNGG